jgi:hypothetical protein
MRRSFGARLSGSLNRPLFGTRIIPADAQVDVKRLPEDEFPVYCPKCEYLLRGLPDGRCPECGSPFERGELLLRQYVREGGVRFFERTRLGRIALRCWPMVLLPGAVMAACCVSIVVLARWQATLPERILPPAAWRAVLVSCVALTILFGFGTPILFIVWQIRFSGKRRAVIDAIFPTGELQGRHDP